MNNLTCRLESGTINNMTTYTLKVPQAFFYDHYKRGCVTESGEETQWLVSNKKTHYIVSLHIEDVLDLLSDANHYRTEWKEMGPDFFGLGMSAKATHKNVAVQMIEQGYVFDERQIKQYQLDRVLPA
jgi:hypothetical protein